MQLSGGRTPAFRDARGHALAGSVAEAGFLQLGGLDQWVMIRGRDLGNPVLILLHGGPGSSETAVFRACNAALEDAFTVIYWDQRGAGRSYSKAVPPQSMTVDQFIADLDELVDAARARFGVAKVTLLGHSWGSALGVLYAARFPDKVAVYVGVGQVADMAASEAASYAFTLAEAERRGHRKAIRALMAIGPPPHDIKALTTERRWLMALGGATGPGFSIPGLFWRGLRTPEASLLDLVRMVQGSMFSVRCLWGALIGANLARDHARLDTPVVMILGRHDMQVAAPVSAAYFEALQAPKKALFWLEKSGHFAPFEEPETFNRLLVEEVRPWVLEAGGAPS